MTKAGDFLRSFQLLHNGLFLQLNSSVGCVFFLHQCIKTFKKKKKKRRLSVANQASVVGGVKRLNSNARNPAAAAATPLCGKINNAKLRFQSHECEAGFPNRWSTQTGEDCLFSAALVTSSGEHSNSDANMQREPALQLPSKEKKNRKKRGGRPVSALPLNLVVRATHISKCGSQRRYKLLGSLCNKCNTGANIDQLINV